jgi:hypothetical protein
MATDELAAGADSAGFSFSIWPPTQRTREAVVQRLVDTLAGDTILCKRYGAVPAADAAASVEEGIEALQFYSKEVSRRLLDFVKSRSAAAAAEAEAAESQATA